MYQVWEGEQKASYQNVFCLDVCEAPWLCQMSQLPQIEMHGPDKATSARHKSAIPL